MRLRALVCGAAILSLAGPAWAQVKVDVNVDVNIGKGKDKDKDKGVKVREHGDADKDKGVKVREHGNNPTMTPSGKVGITVKNFGPTSGAVGTKVTVAGTGFNKTTKVLVGGKPVKLIGQTDVTLLFAIPAKFGDGSIVVRHPGAANDVVAGTFTVIADPVVVAFQPASGPVGTKVEILGSGFMNGDQVLFNGKAIAPLEFAANRIVVVIPAGATSDTFVVSRTGGVQARARKPFMVTLPAPSIASFAPTSGPPGTAVRITGLNFADDDKVYYGKALLNPTARSATTFDVIVPNGARHNDPFVIKGSRGQVQTVQPFTIILNATIARFAPLWGAPGTRVTIEGDNFRPGDNVLMTGKPIPIISLDPNRVVVEIPQGAKSDVFQVQRGGTVMATSTKPFEVVLAPTIASFSPTGGPVGTKVVISGANFGPESRVLYGQQNAKVLSNSGTAIEVAIPPGATNQAFTVRNRGGEAVSKTQFQVFVYSTISSVSPTSGPVGTRVWIRGANFNPTDAFFLGSISLAIVERQPEGYVVQIPAGAASGTIEWESYGRRTASRFRFEVLLPPAITSFTPTSGPPGTQVTITGANFTDKTAVFYGSLPCQVIRRALPGSLVVAIPQNAQGTDYLWVEDAGGARMKSQQTFQIVPPPVISSFSPATGPVGTQVTIQGTNFTGSTTVWYGAVGKLKMEITKRQLPTVLIATLPAGGPAADYIWVEERGQTARSPEMFRTITLPSVSTATPVSGPAGTTVTIVGANFTANTKVWLGALACPVTKRTGTTELQVTIPAGAAKGKAAFTIEDQGQKITTTAMFEVVDAPVPASDHHEHAHEHPHDVGDHHHHPHAHPHRPGSNHHHPY